MIRRNTLALALATLSLLFAGAASALGFSNLFTFGDSIVDVNNTRATVLAATGGTVDVAPPGDGYDGGRFTNGINPADTLNQAIEGSDSSGSLGGGDNYAYGGARARATIPAFPGGPPLPGIVDQANNYLIDVGAVADPNALYFLNIGGNDVRDIVLDGLTGAARQTVIDDSVAAIVSAIDSLQSAGAQNFLFAGVGDVGGIPEIVALGAAAAAEGRTTSEDINTAIQAALDPSVIFFDTIALTDAVFADPAAFGLPPGILSTPSCLSSGAPDPSGPTTCTDSIFFDDVYPTTQVS